MAKHVGTAQSYCNRMGYRKAKEACEKLESFSPGIYDDNSRVTGDQWREMRDELLALEKTLADTKVLLQEFTRVVTAGTMGIYK